VKLTRSLLLIAVFGMLGSMNANTGNLNRETVLKNPSLCIPCTSYCKTHPNAPRCN
jgi:hypothetical protein